MKYQRERTRNTLRSCREILGLTQREVAAKMGCTVASIDRWEKGTSMPNLDQLLHICALCKVMPEQVYFVLFKKLRNELLSAKKKPKVNM